MQVSTPKNGGKRQKRSAWCISLPSVACVDTCINPKNITTIPYHLISTLLNVNFDFHVTVANDVAIDVAKFSLSGKVMQWSPCPEVRTLTNENGRYMSKLNNYTIYFPSMEVFHSHDFTWRNFLLPLRFTFTLNIVFIWF